tara:strand:+ start:490 stop:1086 length:597 start_codon:yes stop_codon:yes gene_type:complete
VIKRIFDIILTLIGVLFLFPVILLTAFMVKIKLGSPLFFKQERPGLKGKPFFIYKYRTMTIEYDKNGALLADKDRLTNFGKFLRSSSLDELPGLWSVLKGDMSLVGPRPLLIEYLPFYSKKHSRRHDVKPGITGWAQVNGRNAISWNEKFDLDVWYVDNQSFWLDVKIVFQTVKKVIMREGISPEDVDIMPRFDKNEN